MIKNAVERFALPRFQTLRERTCGERLQARKGARHPSGSATGEATGFDRQSAPFDAEDAAFKEASALGSLYADRLLEKLRWSG